jgi:hypothetical protein
LLPLLSLRAAAHTARISTRIQQAAAPAPRLELSESCARVLPQTMIFDPKSSLAGSSETATLTIMRALYKSSALHLPELAGLDQHSLFDAKLAPNGERLTAPTAHHRGDLERGSRDRVTIDLRGMRERLQAHAAVHKMTTAALVRKALVALLTDDPRDLDTCQGNTITSGDGQVVKVTLRLSAAHAFALARRARAADVSQGAYVAGLINGAAPAPRPPDHTHAVAALVGSTDQLAAMGADLNAFMRLLGRGSSSEVESYRASIIITLADDVRSHLATVAPLIAELRSARRPR